MGSIDYDTLSDLQVDLLQLANWTKEVSAIRVNMIRFFFKDVAEHGPCKTTDVKVMLLFLFVF